MQNMTKLIFIALSSLIICNASDKNITIITLEKACFKKSSRKAQTKAFYKKQKPVVQIFPTPLQQNTYENLVKRQVETLQKKFIEFGNNLPQSTKKQTNYFCNVFLIYAA